MNIKKYLPYENYLLTTKLSIDEIRKRILDNIEPKKKYSLFETYNSTKVYEEELFNNIFKLNRIIVKRQDSFTPVITGI